MKSVGGVAWQSAIWLGNPYVISVLWLQKWSQGLRIWTHDPGVDYLHVLCEWFWIFMFNHIFLTKHTYYLLIAVNINKYLEFICIFDSISSQTDPHTHTRCTNNVISKSYGLVSFSASISSTVRTHLLGLFTWWSIFWSTEEADQKISHLCWW